MAQAPDTPRRPTALLPESPGERAARAYRGPSSPHSAAYQTGCNCHRHEGLKSWGHASGTVCRHTSPLPLSHSGARQSGGSLWMSLLPCVTVSLSASPSLSRPGQLSSHTAALPACHSRAFPQEAESEGPPRSGCGDISAGAGCAAQGPARAVEAGALGSLGCAAEQRGTGHRLPAASAPIICSKATCSLHVGGEPPAPDRVTDLLSLGICPPSTKPVFSVNACLALLRGDDLAGQGRAGVASPTCWPSLPRPTS